MHEHGGAPWSGQGAAGKDGKQRGRRRGERQSGDPA